MNKFKIGLLQIVSEDNDQEKNLIKGLKYCEDAANHECDLVLFPEMWNVGYSFPEDKGLLEKYAITKTSDFLERYREAAIKLEIAIAITYMKSENNQFYNTITIIDKKGKEILEYSKVHTCDFSKESTLTPGNDIPVSSLEIKNDNIKLGAMICFDREHPETARILAIKGAEIIVVPNACEMEQNRIAQLQTRAFENMVGIILANYASPQENGNSIAFDGMAFDSKGKSRNTKIFEAGSKEGLYCVTFDIAELRKYRKREVWGDTFRKPSLYKKLIDNAPIKEFRRSTSRR